MNYLRWGISGIFVCDSKTPNLWGPAAQTYRTYLSCLLNSKDYYLVLVWNGLKLELNCILVVGLLSWILYELGGLGSLKALNSKQKVERSQRRGFLTLTDIKSMKYESEFVEWLILIKYWGRWQLGLILWSLAPMTCFISF